MAGLVAIATTAHAQPAYTLNGSFTLPADAWSVAPNGLIWGIEGNSIVRQTALNASTYTTVGSVPAGTVSSFGASFLSVSPDGSRLAIGDNNFGAGSRVHFVNTSDLGPAPTATSSVLSGNFQGAWVGNQFFVSGAGTDFVPFVNRIAFTNATGEPVATRILTNIGGASGGVAVLNTLLGPRLYTGVGFAGAGLVAGDIRGFDLLSLGAGGTPTLYAQGTPVAGGPALSASTLAFDSNNVLLVGGFDGGQALAIDILTGARTALSPAGTTGGYSVAFNAFTNEALVSQNGVAYRYRIPTPGAIATLALTGLLAARRRR